MSQNVQHSGPYIKYSAEEKKERWWNWHSPELKDFLHLKQSSLKKNMVLLDGMWWFGTTLKTILAVVL